MWFDDSPSDRLYQKFQNSTWQMAAILKIGKNCKAHLQNRSAIFDEILHSVTHWASRPRELSKYSNFQKSKIVDGTFLKTNVHRPIYAIV